MNTNPSTTFPVAQATTSSSTGKLIRLHGVLDLTTFGRSHWLQGVKDGRYPAPVRLSPRRVAWRESDILDLIDQLAAAK